MHPLHLTNIICNKIVNHVQFIDFFVIRHGFWLKFICIKQNFLVNWRQELNINFNERKKIYD